MLVVISTTILSLNLDLKHSFLIWRLMITSLHVIYFDITGHKKTTKSRLTKTNDMDTVLKYPKTGEKVKKT